LTAALAEDAIEAGADFLVTPAVVPAVLDVGVARGTAVYCGALTPTEVLMATEHGASAIKLFPASALAPRYIGELRGPFPGISFMPSGGVAIDDVSGWLAAGASAVSLGGSLTRDALQGDTSGLRERARRAVSLAEEMTSS
jgi:2-dehydro-3-deoxyphosphogluconate aldolase/(4S)-4-hydroxy-2-oxoglutarate aldolase